ncbi:MAG: hypothetical protein F6K35_20115 [Okeania sp. SIO2H7]|nr:hypothetical protein [Okeania sp. SIO2H7]
MPLFSVESEVLKVKHSAVSYQLLMLGKVKAIEKLRKNKKLLPKSPSPTLQVIIHY